MSIISHCLVENQPYHGFSVEAVIARHVTAGVRQALADRPAVLLHGARQTGNSTLIRTLAEAERPVRRYLTLDVRACWRQPMRTRLGSWPVSTARLRSTRCSGCPRCFSPSRPPHQHECPREIRLAAFGGDRHTAPVSITFSCAGVKLELSGPRSLGSHAANWTVPLKSNATVKSGLRKGSIPRTATNCARTSRAAAVQWPVFFTYSLTLARYSGTSRSASPSASKTLRESRSS